MARNIALTKTRYQAKLLRGCRVAGDEGYAKVEGVEAAAKPLNSHDHEKLQALWISPFFVGSATPLRETSHTVAKRHDRTSAENTPKETPSAASTRKRISHRSARRANHSIASIG